jgi:hypothetical protein
MKAHISIILPDFWLQVLGGTRVFSTPGLQTTSNRDSAANANWDK